jgi:hypothetical protein
VAARRDASGALLRHDEPHQLREGIEDNLATLGISRLAAVNLRMMGAPEAPAAGSTPSWPRWSRPARKA